MSQTNRISADCARFSTATRILGGVEVMHATFHTHRFSPHLHDTWSIGAVVSGAKDNSAGARPNVIQEGQLVVTPPHRPHAGRVLGSGPCQYVMLYVSDSQLRANASLLGLNDVEIPENAISDRFLARRLTEFVFGLLGSEKLSSRRYASLEHDCRALLDEILLRYATMPNRSGGVDALKYERRLHNALEHLESHWNKAVSLDDLARRAAMSPAHFCRRFSQIYGLPPHRYQLVMRMIKAKLMLHSGEQIGRVALQAGFADHSHFGRQFKSCFGFSPGQAYQRRS